MLMLLLHLECTTSASVTTSHSACLYSKPSGNPHDASYITTKPTGCRKLFATTGSAHPRALFKPTLASYVNIAD
ncbi:hypothetical protein BDR05DRAFT_962123 [Suillus weaverae]|nr:hypothetical protein BDR05DRAFT_962123 [Suillus weaverae]